MRTCARLDVCVAGYHTAAHTLGRISLASSRARHGLHRRRGGADTGDMTNLRSAGAGAIVLTLVLAGAPGRAAAQMFVPTGRDTLRGLPGVEVAIESLPPGLERAGLGTALVRADVEGRLRGAGLTVYATQTQNPSPAKPYVYVHLNLLELPGIRAVAVQVHLRQTLRSAVTGSSIVNAMTWDAHDVVGLTTADVGPLRDVVLEMIDRFIADWRAVH